MSSCVFHPWPVLRQTHRADISSWMDSGIETQQLSNRTFSVLFQNLPLTLPHQFNSFAQSYPTLCDPMDCSTPGLPIHHQLPELTQSPVHQVGDTIQPSHPLLSPSPPACNLSQHQVFFKWVSYSHQTAKVLEFQLKHQSFQWILVYQQHDQPR